MVKKIVVLSLVLLIILMLAGCNNDKSESQPEFITSLKQLNESGRRIGVPTGAKSTNIVMEQLPEAEIVDYKNIGEGFIALKTGKIDGFCFDRNIMQYVVNQNPDLTLLDASMDKNDLAIGARNGDTDLINRVNAVIKTFNDNGLRAEMESRWLSTDLNPIMAEIEKTENPTETLIIGISDENRPMSYIDSNGSPAGFDVEYALRLGKELNVEIEFAPMEWVALIPSLQSERIDLIVSNLNVTEERRQALLLSDIYAETDIVMMVRKNQSESNSASESTTQGVLRPEDFIGKRISVATGEGLEEKFAENIGPFTAIHCNYEHEALEMLKIGRADALMLDEPMARKWVLLNPELTIVYPPFAQYDFGAIFGGEKESLRLHFNEFLKQIKENGVHDDMTERWLDTTVSPPMPDIPLDDKNGVLVFASYGELEPFGYIVNGEPVGFDIELARRFAEYMGMGLEIKLMSWESLIPYVSSGKADFAASLLVIDDERSEGANFSDPYYTGGAVLVTKKPENTRTLSMEELDGKTFAILTGTIWDKFVEDNFKNAEQMYFNSIPEAYLALKQGKVDATFTVAVLAEKFKIEYPDLEILFPPIFDIDAAFVFAKDNSEGDSRPQLRESFNAFMAEIRANGVYEDMEERWINTLDSPPMPEIISTGEKATVAPGGKLVFGTTGEEDVFSFIQDGESTGFEVEIAKRFALYMNMELEIQLIDFAGLIPAVQSGKVDFAGNGIAVTEERAKAIDFSDTVYSDGIAVVVRKNNVVNSVTTPGELRPEDWVGKSIGVITGTVHDQVIEKYFPGAIPVYFNDLQSKLMSLENGRIDGMLTDEADFKVYSPKYPGLRLLEPYFDEGNAGMLVSKDKPELLEKINAFLALNIANGTHDEMFERWVGNEGSMPDDIPVGTGEVLRLGTSGTTDGFSFYKDGEIVGFDIEFARRFAAHENMQLEITVLDIPGLIPALQSGRIDYAANCFAFTEERAEHANYTDPYYTTARAIAVYDMAEIPTENESFFQSIKTAVERNLIREDRWKLIVDGLCVSLIITIFAFALATVLGFAVCFLRMSKNRILKAIGSIYIMVLRGTPIVVLLMITFYVIFAKSSISGVMVAIIAFGINGAAFIGEIIRSAILTVDKGQIEAARSMGFGKVGAFLTVTFPQAARVAFPVYMSEFISLFKMTAVVGYIAIIDLTKAGDIIRSRTYDAFFPLIFVALVYLAAASLMIWLFGRIDYLTNKRLRRRKKPSKQIYINGENETPQSSLVKKGRDGND